MTEYIIVLIIAVALTAVNVAMYSYSRGYDRGESDTSVWTPHGDSVVVGEDEQLEFVKLAREFAPDRGHGTAWVRKFENENHTEWRVRHMGFVEDGGDPADE